MIILVTLEVLFVVLVVWALITGREKPGPKGRPRDARGRFIRRSDVAKHGLI
jgi:hypothetical protein